MIKHKTGNIFSAESGYLIHGCNAQGVMGSGVARQVKECYPGAFDIYVNSKHELGTNTYYDAGKYVIVNAVTQESFGSGLQTDYDAVSICFEHLAKYANNANYEKIVHFPLIGCGLGGGDWEVVSQIIEEELDDSFEKILWTLK